MSKKDRAIRGSELVKIIQTPLSNFFEEKLSFMLDDKKPNPLMKQLFISLAATGLAGTSDLVDEMLRQVQKSKAYEESEPGV